MEEVSKSNRFDESKSFEIDDSHGFSVEKVEKQKSAHPVIWISLSLVVAMWFACGNIIISYIVHYGIRSRFLQSPGNIVGNSLPLIIITFNERFGKTQSTQRSGSRELLIDNSIDKSDKTWFNWLRELYFTKEIDKNGKEHTIWFKKRVLATCLLVILDWIATLIFFVFFKQKLLWFEYVGIFLCVSWAAMIGFSADGLGDASPKFESSSYSTQMTLFLSLFWLNVWLIMFSSRSVIVKYFVAFKENQGNVSAYFNFSILWQDIICTGILILLILYGFDFTISDFLIGSFGGSIYSAWGYLIAYVNIRGRAGASDAIIETWVIYQTILDAIVFGRIPNTLQIWSIIVGFSATLILLWGHTKTKQ